MKEVCKDRVSYATGAVRSSDAELTRYDLVSPIGLAAVAAVCAEGEADGRFSGQACISEALRRAYMFLAGDRNADHLAHAALAVMLAIQENSRVQESMHPLPLGEVTEGSALFPSRCNMFRYDLIPPKGIEAVAAACAEGASRYGDWNWERGMGAADMLNHAIRHIFKFTEGDRSEDHLGHAAWNLMAAIHSLELWPELNEGAFRTGNCEAPT